MLDLRYLKWDDTTAHGSSFGMLNKAEEFTSTGKHFYYKMSRMQGSSVVGHEAIFEYIASRALDVLDIPHVSYNLLPANIFLRNKELKTVICQSEDYKQSEDEAIPICEYCLEQSLAEQTIVNDFGLKSLFQIYLVDFILNNVDRHGYNIEIVNGMKIAPLFDHGNSLLYWAPNEESIRSYDVMTDSPTNNYIGDESLYINLHKISHPVSVTPLTERARSYIFYNVKNEFLPQQIKDKTWEMIWRRYNYAKDKDFLVERRATPTDTSSYFSSC